MSESESMHERWLNRTIADRYTIESVLGEGGFGSVYRAIQNPLGREVAIKVLQPQAVGAADAVERFLREAKTIGRLRCPHTIVLFDFGQTNDGDLYMVLELAPGQPLSRILHREKKLSPARVASIAAQICDALAESHELGIVHRDLKPSNIMIEDRKGADFVKVLDFGIAKLLVDEQDGFKTRTGVIFGTPSYMSPEQARAEGICPGSDLYSLGTLMYRALAGHHVFVHANQMKVIMAHLKEPAPPLPAGIPAELASIVLTLLEKSPEARPATAEDVARRLRALRLTGPDVPVTPAVRTPVNTAVGGGDATRALKRSRPSPEPPAPSNTEPHERPQAEDWSAFKTGTGVILASNEVDQALQSNAEPGAVDEPSEEQLLLTPQLEPKSLPPRLPVPLTPASGGANVSRRTWLLLALLASSFAVWLFWRAG